MARATVESVIQAAGIEARIIIVSQIRQQAEQVAIMGAVSWQTGSIARD